MKSISGKIRILVLINVVVIFVLLIAESFIVRAEINQPEILGAHVHLIVVITGADPSGETDYSFELMIEVSGDLSNVNFSDVFLSVDNEDLTITNIRDINNQQGVTTFVA